jgi:hypothetical protein
MELTQEIVSRFVGGELEVQNPGEGYLYRGEIGMISVTGEGDDQNLTVELSWFAKMVSPGEWEAVPITSYQASMMVYIASNIGSGRIFLSSMVTGEGATLFPPDGSKLDRTKVKGLANA